MSICSTYLFIGCFLFTSLSATISQNLARYDVEGINNDQEVFRALEDNARAEDAQKNIRIYSFLAKENPHNPKYFYKLGQSYYKMGKWDDAIEALSYSLELEPKNADVRKTLAHATLSRNRANSKENDLLSKRAIEDYPAVLNNYSRSLVKKPKENKRIEQNSFSKVGLAAQRVESNPLKQIVSKNDSQTEDHQKNILIYSVLAKENPHNPKYFYKLGQSYYKMGKWDDAIEALSYSLELEPKNADARKTLAHATLSHNRANKSTEKNPTVPDEQAKNNYSKLLLKKLKESKQIEQNSFSKSGSPARRVASNPLKQTISKNDPQSKRVLTSSNNRIVGNHLSKSVVKKTRERKQAELNTPIKTPLSHSIANQNQLAYVGLNSLKENDRQIKPESSLLDDFYDLKNANYFVDAHSELERVLTQDPLNPVAHLEMAYLLTALETENTINESPLPSNSNQLSSNENELPSLDNYYDFVSAEDFESARSELNRILCEYPSYPLASLEMAYLLLNQDEYKEAISHLVRAYEFMDRDPKVAFQIAYTYDILDESDKAEPYYKEAALSSDPEIKKLAQDALETVTSPQRGTPRSATSSQQKEPIRKKTNQNVFRATSPVIEASPAITRYKQKESIKKADEAVLITKKPDSLSKYYELRATNDLTKAQEELENVLKDEPFNSMANLEMGNLLISEDKDSDALPYLLNAYELTNGDPKIALQLANVYDRLNQPEKSEFYYKEALLSKDPAIKEKAGEVLKNRTEKLPEVPQVINYQSEQSYNSDSQKITVPRSSLAKNYDRINPKEDSKFIESVKTQVPASIESRPYPVGNSTGDPNKASNVDTLRLLAKYYELRAVNDFIQAKEELKNALKVNSSNAVANLEMAYLLMQGRKDRESLPYFLTAYEHANQDSSIALQIAYLYGNLGKLEESKYYYEQAALSQDPEIKREAEASLKDVDDEIQHPSLTRYYELRETNELAEARLELERILKIDPSSQEANLEMAYLLLQNHKDSESLPYLIKAYDSANKDPKIALQIAYTYDDLEDFKKAKFYYEQAGLSQDPDIQKQVESALKAVYEKIQHPPLTKYYALREANEFIKARNELEWILKIDPSSPEANLEMAYLLLSDKKDKESLPYLVKAYYGMNRDPKIALQIASVYDGMEDFEKAKSFYEQAIASEDLDTEKQAQEALKIVYGKIRHPPLTRYYKLREANELVKAQAELQRILKIDPASPEANLEMAYLLLNDHKDVESLPYLHRAYEINHDPKIALQIALIYDDMEDFEKARSFYEQATWSKDSDVQKQAHESLQAVYDKIRHPPLTRYYKLREAKELEKARDELERILNIDPYSPDANLEMAYLLINDHKDEESLSYLFMAYQTNQDPKIALQIGYTYNQLEQFDRAEPYFRFAATSQDPDVRKQAEDSLSQRSEQFMGGQGSKTSFFRPFMELYNENLFLSRFSEWVILVDAKIGFSLDEEKRHQLYIEMRYNTDTRSVGAKPFLLNNPLINNRFSESFSDSPNDSFLMANGAANNMNAAAMTIGQTPILFDDPLFLIAGGYRYKVFKNQLLYVYATAGIAYDLIYRLRKIGRKDFRAGITYYVDWEGSVTIPTPCCRYSFSHLGDYNFDFSYYSRYGYWIGYATLKEGTPLFKNACSELNAYLRLFAAVDTKGEFFNNVIEIGPLLEYTPFISFPLKLSTYWLQGFYYKNNGPSKNPYGPRYTDFRILITFYTDL